MHLNKHGGRRYMRDWRGLCGVCWGITGEQQSLRTAGAVPNVFCDSKMCQPCLVALGAGHLLPPWQHWLLGWGWLSRVFWREEEMRDPDLLPFLFLRKNWENWVGGIWWWGCWARASCSTAISSSCYPVHKPKGPPLPAIQNGLCWLLGTFGRREGKLFA